MDKKEALSELAQQCGISREDAWEWFEAYLRVLAASLEREEPAVFEGFGVFSWDHQGPPGTRVVFVPDPDWERRCLPRKHGPLLEQEEAKEPPTRLPAIMATQDTVWSRRCRELFQEPPSVLAWSRIVVHFASLMRIQAQTPAQATEREQAFLFLVTTLQEEPGWWAFASVRHLRPYLTKSPLSLPFHEHQERPTHLLPGVIEAKREAAQELEALQEALLGLAPADVYSFVDAVAEMLDPGLLVVTKGELHLAGWGLQEASTWLTYIEQLSDLSQLCGLSEQDIELLLIHNHYEDQLLAGTGEEVRIDGEVLLLSETGAAMRIQAQGRLRYKLTSQRTLCGAEVLEELLLSIDGRPFWRHFDKEGGEETENLCVPKHLYPEVTANVPLEERAESVFFKKLREVFPQAWADEYEEEAPGEALFVPDSPSELLRSLRLFFAGVYREGRGEDRLELDYEPPPLYGTPRRRAPLAYPMYPYEGSDRADPAQIEEQLQHNQQVVALAPVHRLLQTCQGHLLDDVLEAFDRLGVLGLLSIEEGHFVATDIALPFAEEDSHSIEAMAALSKSPLLKRLELLFVSQHNDQLAEYVGDSIRRSFEGACWLIDQRDWSRFFRFSLSDGFVEGSPQGELFVWGENMVRVEGDVQSFGRIDQWNEFAPYEDFEWYAFDTFSQGAQEPKVLDEFRLCLEYLRPGADVSAQELSELLVGLSDWFVPGGRQILPALSPLPKKH